MNTPQNTSKSNYPLSRFARIKRLLLRERLTIAPLIAVAVFVLALVATYAYLTRTEDLQRIDALQRNLDWTQQTIRLRLQATAQDLGTLGRAHAAGEVTEGEFNLVTRQLLDTYPSLVAITRIDQERVTNYAVVSPRLEQTQVRVIGKTVEEPASFAAFEAARDSKHTVYSNPFLGLDEDVLFEIQIPLIYEARFVGTVTAIHSMQQLLQREIPPQVAQRYSLALLDSGGNMLVSNGLKEGTKAQMSYELPLDPPGHGVLIRANALRNLSDLPRNLLFAAAGLMSVLTLVILVLLWRDTRRRARAERALVAETGFRRAMENSMLTGMRAFDLKGQVTYVNPAFCRMIGWQESELLGSTQPFPYWPPDQLETNRTNMQQVLQGQAPPGGMEVELIRKNGSRLHARMYVSPLIDEDGVQTGWMTSMTDITEPKRIREELASAHERFTTVLASLEDAISVTVTQGEAPPELLFANNAYKNLFGNSAFGHIQLKAAAFKDEVVSINAASLASKTNLSRSIDVLSELPVKVQLADTQQWFEVRHQAIEWVDGRIVQLQVASDVSAAHQQEQIVQQHQEAMQRSSRLITMGEMASTLAHELNQPLAAISNYCMGLVVRANDENTTASQLVPALEKASQQAQRAGKIIKRIREFVKRSEPKRKMIEPSVIAINALALAELDAQRRGFNVVLDIADNLPAIPVDPILIEQVLLNLLRNAMESMQDAPARTGRRKVRLTVQRAQIDDQRLEFAVHDRGHGIAPADMSRLFDAFFTTKADGMGMGLNICRTIVELHNGRLWAQDNPGGGTVFTVQLPVQHIASEIHPTAEITPEHNQIKAIEPISEPVHH